MSILKSTISLATVWIKKVLQSASSLGLAYPRHNVDRSILVMCFLAIFFILLFEIGEIITTHHSFLELDEY